MGQADASCRVSSAWGLAGGFAQNASYFGIRGWTAVGDVLPLSGATVGSVRLFAPDDVMVGKARLGQSAGMRAVRIQAPPEPELRDIPAPKSAEIARVD